MFSALKQKLEYQLCFYFFISGQKKNFGCRAVTELIYLFKAISLAKNDFFKKIHQ